MSGIVRMQRAGWLPTSLSFLVLTAFACGRQEDRVAKPQESPAAAEETTFNLDADGGGGGSSPTVEVVELYTYVYKPVSYYYSNVLALYGNPNFGYVDGPTACKTSDENAGPLPPPFFPLAAGKGQKMSDDSTRKCGGFMVTLSPGAQPIRVATAEEARALLPQQMSADTYQCSAPVNGWLFDSHYVITTTYEVELVATSYAAPPGIERCESEPTPTPQPTEEPTPEPTPTPLPQCPVLPVEEPTDELSKRMLAGEQVILDGLNPDVLDGMNCLKDAVREAGGRLAIKSAYRPPGYQGYLRDIWMKNDELRALSKKDPNTAQACKDVMNDVTARVKRHGLGHLETAPAKPLSGAHPNGRAFDARWPSKLDPVIDDLAKECGLYRRMKKRDKVHFEAIPTMTPKPLP